LTRQGDRRIRCILKTILATATFLATFALLMDLCDTQTDPEGGSPDMKRPEERSLGPVQR
jgi:hypothetical protein